ncbi:ATP-binding response regulator [Chitinophaga sp. NPDC101104]|uniref:ATP-binding response regulator n=1 Tax=Chitinophaga sp. NPDC101104 TaxID=3390561 RepID=UPI003D00CAF8
MAVSTPTNTPELSLSKMEEVQQRSVAHIVTNIAIVTFGFAILFGQILYLMSGDRSILIAALIEAFLCVAIIAVNEKENYRTAVLLTFITHCSSTFYFGLMFTSNVPVDTMIIFLGGIACLIFQRLVDRIFAVALVALLTLTLEYNYLVQFAPANTNTQPIENSIRYMVIGTVGFLTIMMLYFYSRQIRMWKRKASDQLNQVETSKNAVVKYVMETSHQARNDLNVVYGIIQHDLQAGAAPMQHMQIMCNGIRAVIDQSNNYLNWAKVEKGLAFSINFEPMNFHDWMNNIVGRFRFLAESRSLILHLILPAPAPAWIMMDKIALDTIISNLLTNAIKYTLADTIIKLKIETTDDEIHFFIIDQGKGMDKEKLVSIFEPFTSEGSSFLPSTGLGLPVSKEMAHALGGELTAYSSIGMGSTFRVTLPLMLAAPQKAGSQPTRNLSDLHVLVAEDDPMQQKVIKMNLEQQRMIVHTANSKDEFLNSLHSQKIDVVVADYQLPGFTGLDIVNWISNTPDWKNIPVIITSGETLSGDRSDIREYALSIGAARFLSKPLDFKQLADAIANVIEPAEKTMSHTV